MDLYYNYSDINKNILVLLGFKYNLIFYNFAIKLILHV